MPRFLIVTQVVDDMPDLKVAVNMGRVILIGSRPDGLTEMVWEDNKCVAVRETVAEILEKL